MQVSNGDIELGTQNIFQSIFLIITKYVKILTEVGTILSMYFMNHKFYYNHV